MKTSRKAFLSLILAMLMLAALAACAKESPQPSGSASVSDSSKETESSTSTSEETEDIVLPLSDEPITYKGFMAINRSEYDPTLNELMNKLAEETNIYIDWEFHLTGSGATEAFNLMLTSGKYPDFILMDGLSYPGGFEAGVEDGILLDLKDMLPEYMPHYWAELSSQPQAIQDITTPAGYIPGIFQFNKDLYMDQPNLLMGLMVRGDWLKDLNMEVPQTIDDWDVMLRAFKEEKGCDFPLLIGPSNGVEACGYFMSAFGIATPPASGDADQTLFYPDENGVMRYGALEEGYQQYLELMSKWYAEGLYDRDFTTRNPRDLPGRAALAADDKAGAVAIYVDWQGMFYSAATDPDFELVAVPYPALNAGEKQKISLPNPKYTYQPLVITSSCENPEPLMRFWDYLSYGQGLIEKNYGIEGDDYTMVDGKPMFTDKILKHDFGTGDAAQMFTFNYYPVRLSNSEDVVKQLMSEEMLAKKEVWFASSDPVFRTWQVTAEEGERLNRILSDIRPYVEEQTVRAIMDPEVAANWMEVQAKQVEEMGIGEALEIMQGVYERYLAG